MKRILFFLAITMATIYSLSANQVSETAARQVADQFFSAKSSRLMAPAGSSATRLAYTAEHERFYVFDRGNHGGFVVVSGDDRLPQVLGYGDKGGFGTPILPPAVKYWMDGMNRQIEFLQAHNDAAAHQPTKRADAVGPLMTTRWNQSWPYNNYCPTYDDGDEQVHAVTGCVATATAQIMNYYQWPAVGRGSHGYTCNVNGETVTDLYADFSESVYRWELMLDDYDEGSSAESCDAVARLMSDVGISMDMGYGSSSGASEKDALMAMKRYFDYYDKAYLLNRDNYGAAEWDQMLVDELSAGRPILYCGFDLSPTTGGGHAFVIDGFDTEGYFHLNWGWGGSYDGFFLVSALSPGGMNFKYMQDGMFGVVPSPRADEVADVLYVRSQLRPIVPVVRQGGRLSMVMDYFVAEGNKLDTAGYEEFDGRRHYYALIPMSLDIYDMNGVERAHHRFSREQSLDDRWWSSGQYIYMDLPGTLEDGEYRLKLSYSQDGGSNYDHRVLDPNGRETYVKMIVRGDSAYIRDCFLSSSYSIDSFNPSVGIKVNEPFTVEANLSNPSWDSDDQPTGNVYLSLLKDGKAVSSSEMYEIMIPSESSSTYQMQMTAPAEWGLYELAMFDEGGYQMQKIEDIWFGEAVDYALPLIVLPICEQFIEDFESMAAGSSTNAKDVQGNFTTWSFTKGGVRAPGEGRCNGVNSVMLKKGSTMFTTQPLNQNFFMAQVTFFNQSTTAAKYTLEYSFDGGTTWVKATTLNGLNAAEVPEKSEYVATWQLKQTLARPVTFRIAMIGGGSAATYVDDVVFYYKDNYDGEVTIADINVIIDCILTGVAAPSADVNGDGEISIADINALIDMMLGN